MGNPQNRLRLIDTFSLKQCIGSPSSGRSNRTQFSFYFQVTWQSLIERPMALRPDLAIGLPFSQNSNELQVVLSYFSVLK